MISEENTYSLLTLKKQDYVSKTFNWPAAVKQSSNIQEAIIIPHPRELAFDLAAA